MPSNCLILCHPLLLLPSIFPSIRVFSSGSVLHIRWPKYWNFSFSDRPSNEYSGFISFRVDWFELFAVQYQIIGINNSVDMSLYELREIVKDREAWRAAVHRVAKSRMDTTEQLN